MRSIATVGLISSLLVSSAFAGESLKLAPGRPAGVKHAQEMGNSTLLLVVGAAAAVAGIALAASAGGDSAVIAAPATTTTTTATTS